MKTTESSNFRLTHARHDQLHCLAPGLFRCLMRGGRKKEKLELVYKFGAESIEIDGKEPLGADDLRVLQGLVALSRMSDGTTGGRYIIINDLPQTDMGMRLRKALELEWEAVKSTAVVTRGSYRQLAHEIGYDPDSTTSRNIIRRSIRRLNNVTLTVTLNGNWWSSHLLSFCAGNEASGQLIVALNGRLTEAIVGKRKHTRIELSEARALKSEAAHIIHQRLCGWIDPGKTGRVSLDVITMYCYPNTAENKNTTKSRRKTAKNGLLELKNAGWKINEYACGRYEIVRPGKTSRKRPVTIKGKVIKLRKTQQSNPSPYVTQPQSVRHPTPVRTSPRQSL